MNENETKRVADRLDTDILVQAINLWFTKTELEIEKLKFQVKQLKRNDIKFDIELERIESEKARIRSSLGLD